jgi:hypothetical protein
MVQGGALLPPLPLTLPLELHAWQKKNALKNHNISVCDGGRLLQRSIVPFIPSPCPTAADMVI